MTPTGRRNFRAFLGYVLLLGVTGYFDILLALEAGFISLWISMLIWQSKYDWKQPWGKVTRITKIVFTCTMMSILGLFLVFGVDAVSSLVIHNFNKQTAEERLRFIVAALQQYDEKHGRMPSATNYSPRGESLLSWRVHLLPYLGQQELYDRFHLEEPWNSPHNLTLLQHIPPCYDLGRYARPATRGDTCFQLIVGPGAFFEPGKQRSLIDLKKADRVANTIIAAVAHDTVPWTMPSDLVFDGKIPLSLGSISQFDPVSPLGTLFQGSNSNVGERGPFQIVTAEGRAFRFNDRSKIKGLLPFITWQGGEKVELESFLND